jgi:YVTN family beta-propeller protein
MRGAVCLTSLLSLFGAIFIHAADDQIVPKGARLDKLWSEGEFTEGPAYGPDACIYFSDIGNRIMRFDPATGKTTVYRDPSGRANGLDFDPQGRLVAAEGANSGGQRRVTITEKDGTVRVLADRWQGKRFNSPNDVTIDLHGRVYFTDPRYVGDEPRDIDTESVYRVDADGTVTRIITDVQKPNGIVLSPDMKTLYLADSNPKGNQHLLAFPLKPDGSVGAKRLLHDFGKQRGIDGMCVDIKGNIYGAAGTGKAGGIYVFNPDGKQIALIPVPETPTNCVFGDPDRKSLYITAGKSLYRIKLNIEGFAVFWPQTPGGSDELDRLKVGAQPDGRIVVPTNQILKPAGQQITFPGRPVDLAMLVDGKTLVVKNMRDLVFIDLAAGRVKQTLALPDEKPSPGFSVVGLVAQGDKIRASDAYNQVRVAQRQADGSYGWIEGIGLRKPADGKEVHPAGIALDAQSRFWVTSTRGNSVHLVDGSSGATEKSVLVGVAPYMVCRRDERRLYVSNWGGDLPAGDVAHGKSSGSPIRIDPRTGVANHGSVAVVTLAQGEWKMTKTIPVGLHPSGMVLSPQRRFLYVTNANSDSVSVIHTESDAVVETIWCRPEARLPFGGGANALAVSPDGGILYVANGTNNCVAVIRLGANASDARSQTTPGASILLGLIPTGWYPGALLLSPDGKKLIVANVKGHGSLSQPRSPARGKRSRDHLGSVSIIDVPDAGQLAKYTAEVNANNRLAYSLAGLEKRRSGVQALPVPRRQGEPSVFKHVIYIIKENRTYDQVFGDIPEGNGDPRLVIFGERVTPNHHALARQFTLFDNFYCSGVLSADGHTWCNEAYVSDYLEKTFGNFTRSYPDDGSDPLAYVPTGFLWDNALAHGKTIRNYGEYITNEYLPKTATWADCYNDYKNGTRKVTVTAKANLKSLEPFTHPGFPWFPLLMPDVYRAKLFIEELKAFEKQGEMPNLIYLTLPCDHTDRTRAGYPTPHAMVADNDLALGQIVEAVSHSKFWPETCIFVVEDDPQDGFDHVDGHRTVALVISPYTKRRYVDRTNYNQTGMVKTIELLLGLPPMNQLDLSATAMRDCFQNQADLAPYRCLPNRIPLDQMNPDLRFLTGQALHWAKKSMEMNLDEGDKADEETMNRILWHASRGDDTPYPEEFTRKASAADND